MIHEENQSLNFHFFWYIGSVDAVDSAQADVNDRNQLRKSQLEGRQRMRRAAVGIVGIVCFGTLGASFAQSRAGRPGATVMELTDSILVENTVRFGINLGGDTYYSGAVLAKNRAQENFEGTTYRQCHFGPTQDEYGATSWFSQPPWWQEPWYCLPGTLNEQELVNFMEYLGAPADVGCKRVFHQSGCRDDCGYSGYLELWFCARDQTRAGSHLPGRVEAARGNGQVRRKGCGRPS